MNPLLRSAIAGLTLVASIALPRTASAQGSLTLVEPGPVVLGQAIDVALRVPRLPADLADRPLFFRWYDSATPLTFASDGGIALADDDVSPRPPASIPNAGAAPSRVTVYAPFEKPGMYELRMFVDTRAYNSKRLLARLRLNVDIGRAREGDSLSGSIYLRLPGKKDVFHVEEAVDVDVTLPPNRYYQGNATGPNVVFYPTKLGGKVVAKEDAVKWLSSTYGCNRTCAPLREQIRISNSQAPIGYGLATRPGPYTVRLQAPAVPGEYEVRLYDRGFSDYGYEDFYL